MHISVHQSHEKDKVTSSTILFGNEIYMCYHITVLYNTLRYLHVNNFIHLDLHNGNISLIPIPSKVVQNDSISFDIGNKYNVLFNGYEMSKRSSFYQVHQVKCHPIIYDLDRSMVFSKDVDFETKKQCNEKKYIYSNGCYDVDLPEFMMNFDEKEKHNNMRPHHQLIELLIYIKSTMFEFIISYCKLKNIDTDLTSTSIIDIFKSSKSIIFLNNLVFSVYHINLFDYIRNNLISTIINLVLKDNDKNVKRIASSNRFKFIFTQKNLYTLNEKDFDVLEFRFMNFINKCHGGKFCTVQFK